MPKNKGAENVVTLKSTHTHARRAFILGIRGHYEDLLDVVPNF